MTIDKAALSEQLKKILRKSIPVISTLLPSEWAEAHVSMPQPFAGPLRYEISPYTREIIDRLAPTDPARVIVVMKGGQLGFSSTIIFPGMGWIIENSPANTVITVGAPDLIPKAMGKLDTMIDGAGLRRLISSQAKRNRKQATGDTNLKKEFPNGEVSITTPNNHKAVRQTDYKYIWLDDFETAKKASKESGDTLFLYFQRVAAYGDSYKLFPISTPERAQTSNIYPEYKKGDQRKYMVPAPCCGVFIELLWDYKPKEGEENSQWPHEGGIRWELDEENVVKPGSTYYRCQACGGKFTDSCKQEMLVKGYWEPTAKPKKAGYVSYHISCLYAPAGMHRWESYATQWVDACPPGQPKDEQKYQSFMNLVLGLPYEEQGEKPRAAAIQKNCLHYKIGTVPEHLSMEHGNGRIVMLTLGADLNGVRDDCRLDFEIVGHTESGSTYSILHGSLGTFIPKENSKKDKKDRKRWSAEQGKPNSIWPEFEKILDARLSVTGHDRTLSIQCATLDTGHLEQICMDFLSKTSFKRIVGVKGKGDEKYVRLDTGASPIKESQSHPKLLYIVTVGKIKDRIAQYMQLDWSYGDTQPANFMNYPEPSNGLYTYAGFFAHYEAEQPLIERSQDGTTFALKWVKVGSGVQNHFWDCRVYNLVARDIVVMQLAKEHKVPQLTWRDVARHIAKNIK